MKTRSIFRSAMAVLLGLAHASHAEEAKQGNALVSARSVMPGSWNVKYDDGTSLKICIADIQAFIQLAHAGPPCGRLIIEDEADRATVHYTCPGAGWGRTSLVVETPRLVRINSQGIANRMPFAFDAEARRIGPCEAAALRKPR